MISRMFDGGPGRSDPAAPAFDEKDRRSHLRQRRLGRSCLSWLRTRLQWIGRAYAAACAEQHLAELDDRLLRDIGLSRQEIRRAVRGSKPAEPGTAHRRNDLMSR